MCVCGGGGGFGTREDEEMISCVHVCFPFSLTKRIAGAQVNEV